MKPISINISEFKAHALRLIAELSKKGREYIIIKKGAPIARIVPYRKTTNNRRGSLKGLVTIDGDIVSYDSSGDWDVLK